jgi:hypothetical protein
MFGAVRGEDFGWKMGKGASVLQSNPRPPVSYRDFTIETHYAPEDEGSQASGFTEPPPSTFARKAGSGANRELTSANFATTACS